MHKASHALPPLACSLACLLNCSLACSHVAMQPRSQAALFVLPSCPTYLLACLLACSLDCLLASLARLLACVLAAMQPFLTTYLQPAAPFLFVCPPLCFETWLRSLVCSLSCSLCLLARLPACSPCSPLLCLFASFFFLLPACISLFVVPCVRSFVHALHTLLQLGIEGVRRIHSLVFLPL